MNRYRSVCALALVVVGLATASLAAQGKSAEPRPKADIVGTWRLVSYQYGDRGGQAPASMVALKHITPAHFEWVRYDAKTKKVMGTAGGRCTLVGEAYKEQIEYGLGNDYEVIKDQEHAFTVTVEGDRLHQKGMLASGLTIDEVWERMK